MLYDMSNNVIGHYFITVVCLMVMPGDDRASNDLACKASTVPGEWSSQRRQEEFVVDFYLTGAAQSVMLSNVIGHLTKCHNAFSRYCHPLLAGVPVA